MSKKEDLGSKLSLFQCKIDECQRKIAAHERRINLLHGSIKKHEDRHKVVSIKIPLQKLRKINELRSNLIGEICKEQNEITQIGTRKLGFERNCQNLELRARVFGVKI